MIFQGIEEPHEEILRLIHFSMLGPHAVAGMGEPWIDRMEETHRAFQQRDIGAILTLTEDNLYGDCHKKAGFIVKHEPMDDGEAPSSLALDRSVAFIDDMHALGKAVAVHCLEGRGRTGTVLAAWLSKKERLGADSAILRLRQLRPITALSLPQKRFLAKYLS